MSKTINVGRVTAYAEAVAGGYTGTREDWERDLANLGTTAAEVEANRQAVAEDKAAVEGDVTTVGEYKDVASAAAAAALQSAESAHTDALAATAAKEAAQTAQGIAEEARADAVSAKGAAESAQTEANASASAAAESALTAQNAAETATANAGAASDSATAAAASAASVSGVVAEVTAAKTEAITAIQTKGAETLDSIPDDYTELSGDVDDLKSALIKVNNTVTKITGTKYIDFSDGYIEIGAVGTVCDTTPVEFDDRQSGVISISEGENLQINVKGVGTPTGGARAFAFLDASYNIISRADRNITINGVLVAPANSAYVVVNNVPSVVSNAYAYVGMVDIANAVATIEELRGIVGTNSIDLNDLSVTRFWIDVQNSVIDSSISIPERLVIIPVESGDVISVYIPLSSTKRVAFCDSTEDQSTAYDAVEIVGSLDRTFVNTDNHNYLVIQLFISSDTDQQYQNYFSTAVIGKVTAKDNYARGEIANIQKSTPSMFYAEDLANLPILDSFSDITINTSAYDNCANFHEFVRENICDTSDGYVTQTLLGNDGHNNNLYKYETFPTALKYGANRNFGTPRYPIAGGKEADIFTLILTTNIHGIEHGSNWVVYNLLYKMLNEDSDMLRFFKSRVKIVWVPYICASGNYENADGININRDFPTSYSGTCQSAEATIVKGVFDEYGLNADLHIDIHTFDTSGTYARYFASWIFTDSEKLGSRGVITAKSVCDRYASKYPSIDLLTKEVVSAVNAPTTSSYYMQTVYGVPAGTIEGALSMDGSPEGSDSHTSATAYLYDIITQVICSMVK